MLPKHPKPKATIKNLKRKARVAQQLRKNRTLINTTIGAGIIGHAIAKGSLEQGLLGLSLTIYLNEFSKHLNRKGKKNARQTIKSSYWKTKNC